ncbi:MAG TPA: hybrid sensor histidine kinase/response regulator [Polyangia bacterium]|jgi:signal transduction histidine kinase
MPPTQPTSSFILGFPADPVALVVDRDAAGRRELCAHLREIGASPIEADSAAGVTAQVKAGAPDLVVLVTDHGETAALDVCMQLKGSAATHLIPLVLVGGKNEPERRLKATTAGADGWFPRPVAKEELLARCWSLLRTRGLVRALEERRRTLRLRQEFVRFLVHDLQNPLTGSVLAVDLARQRLAEAPAAEDLAGCLDDVAYGLTRMAGMVRDLLDVDRFERGHLKLRAARFRLGELLLEIKRSFQPRCIERAAPLWLEGPGDLEVTADRALIERVLGNLIMNAFTYGPHGQPVIVDVAPDAAEVRIAVVNRGEPLPLADRVRIFEPFVRLAERFPAAGAGLGLAFCRLAVEAHGGRIFVEDYAPGGNAFVFTLPWEPRAS